MGRITAATATTTKRFLTIIPLLVVVIIGVSSVSWHGVAANPSSSECLDWEWEEHPVLCRMVQLAETHPHDVARQLYDWAQRHGLLVDLGKRNDNDEHENSTIMDTQQQQHHYHHQQQQQQQLPVVLAHGMGDSCFNDGMQRITKHVSQLLGGSVYTTCIPTGKDQGEDTKNGYFLNMDASVEVFADAIRNDVQLQQGFHAIGFSQGNNLIRGYIAKHNDPTVHTFLSVNGVNAGIGAVPYCRPTTTNQQQQQQQQQRRQLNSLSSSSQSLPLNQVWFPSMCDLLMEQASRSAYTRYAQDHSFQANYWRDPRPVASDRYKTYSQLAVWNNEQDTNHHQINQTLRDNWAKTRRFVWIMAQDDQMVWPKQGEHWGAPDPNNPFHHILPMNETEWYQQDLFGLKAAQEAGKNIFESFPGDHLQFSMEDFDRWVTSYLQN